MPTVTLTATKDSFVYSGASNSNYGNTGYMNISYNGYQEYPIMTFDFSSLPANAYITSATLKLYASTNPNGKSAGTVVPWSISALVDFPEFTVTYGNYFTSAAYGLLDSGGITANVTLLAAGNWYNLDVSSLMKRRIGFAGFMLSYYQSGSSFNQALATRQYSGGISFAPQLEITYSIGSLVTIAVPFHSDYTYNENNVIENTANPTINIGAMWHNYDSDDDAYYYKVPFMYWDVNALRSDAQVKSAGIVARTTYTTKRLNNAECYLFQYNGTEASPVGWVSQGAYMSTAPFGATTAETWFSYDITKAFVARMAGGGYSGYYGVYLRASTQSGSDVWDYVEFYSRNSAYAPYIGVQAVIPNTAPNAPINVFVSNANYVAPYSNVNTRQPIINWTFSDVDAGDSQSQYLVQVVDSAYSYVAWDSGWRVGSTNQFQIPAGAITADGAYWIRVRTMDAAGQMNQANGTSPDVNFTNIQIFVDTVPPNAPTTTIGTITGTTVAVSFTAYSDNAPSSGMRPEGAYVVVDDPQGNRVQTNTTTNLSYTITGLTPNTQYNIWVVYFDKSGNWGAPSAYKYIVTDTRAPDTPTQTNGVLYATSNSVSWSAFSDGTVSSGLLATTLYLQKWNGSAWVAEAGFPKSVSGLTNNFTGLTPATQYRWSVTYTDVNGNVSVQSWTTFTTNTYAVSTITNLTSSGSILNKRPKVRFTVVDANDATLSNFQIQVSTVNTFASTLIDTTSGAAIVGWSGSSTASGGTVSYTPQVDLSVGTLYVRTRAYDGKDWGTWSTTVTFSISAVSWTTTIADDDSAISKRTIDEIRTKVNAVRQARGMSTVTWTDATITDWNGVTPTDVRTTHLIELRQAILDIYTILSVVPPTPWTDNIIDTTIDRKGIHWKALRNALIAI